jgi:BMFP domain-containing protein YqiC
MEEENTVNDIAESLIAAIPDDLSELRSDLEQNFRALLAAGLEKMDLVTREEFDVQTRVLERTREKLERLQQELEELRRDTEA